MKRHNLIYKGSGGRYAEYGKIPSWLVKEEGIDGIVYFVETNFMNMEDHEEIRKEVISMLESDSYDHGSQWRNTENKVIIENDSRGLQYILSLISFRVRDSY